MVTADRVKEVVDYFLEKGEGATIEAFGVTSETLHRYKREYKELVEDYELKATLKKIGEQYTDAELQAIAKGGRLTPGLAKVPIIDFDGDVVTFGFFTDPHMGSVFFQERYLFQFYEECAKRGVDFIACAGDLVEGMSNRPGHIYELSHIGYSQQYEYSRGLLEQAPFLMYVIDGNHDRWFVKAAGAKIVEEIANSLENIEFLGHDEGNINVNGAVVKLWHGEDGNSYATSYRIQKIIEAFQPGEKPSVLLAGHTHKQIYMFERAVHCVSGGCIQMQSNWMRSKRIPAHVGFWIIEMCVSDGDVKWFSPRWYPFYV